MILTAERHRMIVAHVERHGSARVSDLAELFSVTKETIRRDLEKLEEEGRLLRRRGGAINSESTPLPVRTPLSLNGDKPITMSIAQEAARRVLAGSTVLLDCSPISRYVARSLPNVPMTVITNSLPVIQELTMRPLISCLCLGGTLLADTHSFAGPLTEKMLGEYRADIGFFSCRGADWNRGCSETNELQAIIKRRMVEAVSHRILLVESGAFGLQGLRVFAALEDFEELLTDESAPADLIEHLAAQGVAVTQVANTRHEVGC